MASNSCTADTPDCDPPESSRGQNDGGRDRNGNYISSEALERQEPTMDQRISAYFSTYDERDAVNFMAATMMGGLVIGAGSVWGALAVALATGIGWTVIMHEVREYQEDSFRAQSFGPVMASSPKNLPIPSGGLTKAVKRLPKAQRKEIGKIKKRAKKSLNRRMKPMLRKELKAHVKLNKRKRLNKGQDVEKVIKRGLVAHNCCSMKAMQKICDDIGVTDKKVRKAVCDLLCREMELIEHRWNKQRGYKQAM